MGETNNYRGPIDITDVEEWSMTDGTEEGAEGDPSGMGVLG